MVIVFAGDVLVWGSGARNDSPEDFSKNKMLRFGRKISSLKVGIAVLRRYEWGMR